MDVLVQMKNNFDKPEQMANLKKRLTGEKCRGERGKRSERRVRGLKGKEWIKAVGVEKGRKQEIR